MISLPSQIEAYLFYIGEPVTLKKIEKLFNVSESAAEEAVTALQSQLEGRGLVLMHHNDSVALVTAPDAAEMITAIKKQELSEPLSKSALETLAIILYKNKVTKPEIDFIRGVNSGFMLRNLLVRGLIEKVPHESDKRVMAYQPTVDVLGFLGITEISQLPHFTEFSEEFKKREHLESDTPISIFHE